MVVRNAVWFSLISAPIIARNLTSIEFSRLLSPLRRFGAIDTSVRRVASRINKRAPIRYRLNRQIAVLLATIVVLVSPWVYPHLGNPVLGNELWEKETPVAGVDYIEQHELRGNIFHPQIYGDYLIWRLWPQQRTFIDGRVHLFDDAVIRDYRLVFRDSHWPDHLAQYNIKYLMLSKTEEDNRMMIDSARASTDWQLLYEDDVSALFEKR
jgi:hypothetical protein